jgi:hypothetical protein
MIEGEERVKLFIELLQEELREEKAKFRNLFAQTIVQELAKDLIGDHWKKQGEAIMSQYGWSIVTGVNKGGKPGHQTISSNFILGPTRSSSKTFMQVDEPRERLKKKIANMIPQSSWCSITPRYARSVKKLVRLRRANKRRRTKRRLMRKKAQRW